MHNHTEKISGAVLSVAFILFFIIGYIVLVNVFDDIPVWYRLIFTALPAAMGAGLLQSLYDRINEIKGGEEDDLDNY
ncbi:MAG: hypothetical protein IKG15_01880 [Solobacterium sp.]|nr:hypothetical protein [Solobacterium sp.]